MPNKMSWMKFPNVWNSPDERFKEILKAYMFFSNEENKLIHKDSFRYHTKALFENGRVYCSKKAWDSLKDCKYFPIEIMSRLEKGEMQNVYLQNKLYDLKQKTKISLVWEHVVPFDVIFDKFLKNPTKENYINLLNLGVVCIITKDEDKELSDKKLSGKMPGNWDGKDIWARYNSVGIAIV